MNNTRRSFLLVALVAALVVSPIQAASSAQMRVSVQVVARTILTVDSQPATVEVSPADLARGYVEIPAAVAFRVRSNARNGFSVQFQPVSAPFSRAELSWGTTTVAVGTDSSWVAQPYQQGTVATTMNVRLAVAPGTNPGTYAWPVVFGAHSL